MSAYIGSVGGTVPSRDTHAFDVWASVAGAEIRVKGSDDTQTLGPIEARNLAALLVRASEEAERMRARTR